MDQSAIQSFLGTLPLITHFKSQDLAHLAAICTPRTFTAGEIIIEDNTPGDSLFIIVSGKARVQKGSPQTPFTAPIDIAVLRERMLFGELSILAGIPRTATVVAQSDLTVLEITKANFSSLITTDIWTAYKLLYEISRIISWRLKKTDDKLSEFMSKATPSKKDRMKEYLSFKEKLMKEWSIYQ